MIKAPRCESFPLTKQHLGHQEMGLAQQEIAAMEGALAELNKSYLVWIQGTPMFIAVGHGLCTF